MIYFAHDGSTRYRRAVRALGSRNRDGGERSSGSTPSISQTLQESKDNTKRILGEYTEASWFVQPKPPSPPSNAIAQASLTPLLGLENARSHGSEDLERARSQQIVRADRARRLRRDHRVYRTQPRARTAKLREIRLKILRERTQSGYDGRFRPAFFALDGPACTRAVRTPASFSNLRTTHRRKIAIYRFQEWLSFGTLLTRSGARRFRGPRHTRSTRRTRVHLAAPLGTRPRRVRKRRFKTPSPPRRNSDALR